MSYFKERCNFLLKNPKIWVITGVAGFIGSNLLEFLLKLDQKVVGLDNFSTGHQSNLNEVKILVSEKQWSRFKFVEGNIKDYDLCKEITFNSDYVLHQAALGSVPRSIKDPLETNSVNISGFLNILKASMEANVKNFVYAASSSTYGDSEQLPKKEDIIGNPLSPYAITKYVNELYSQIFAKSYGFKSIGLRYFNVFGRRQDPNGAYAAVIPKWVASMISGESVTINGDGTTSRDFCYVENVVQMNILAALADESLKNNIYNVAVGDRTSLNELFNYLKKSLKANGFSYNKKPIYASFRSGDVMHSQADISKARELLKYNPQYKVEEGLSHAIGWYISNKK